MYVVLLLVSSHEMLVGRIAAHLAPKGLSFGSLWLPFGGSIKMPLSPFGAPWLPDLDPDLTPALSWNYQGIF